MSKCMTIDETIDQKETCTEIAPKDIVDFILEEALHSAFLILDKGCSRIGDFNVTDEFRQQYDQLLHVKDFEQVNHSPTQSEPNQETNSNPGQNTECSERENLGSLIDSFVKKDQKTKPEVECTVITEEVLTNNELQIQNGQIYLEKPDKIHSDPNKNNYYNTKEIIKSEKIEIEYYNEGKLNKIYVPLNPTGSRKLIDASGPEQTKYKVEEIYQRNEKKEKNQMKCEKEEVKQAEDKTEEGKQEEDETEEVKQVEDETEEVKQEEDETEEVKQVEDETEEVKQVEDETEEVKQIEDETEEVKQVEDKIEQIKQAEDKTEEEKQVEDEAEEVQQAENKMEELKQAENKIGKVKQTEDQKEEVHQTTTEMYVLKETERPFEPLTTEELRKSTLQIWESSNSSPVGKWDGDALAQREEAVMLMKELSSAHIFPDNSADPNRPRACAFAEEDVKKIIKEIEEISFTQCHTNPEDSDVNYRPDGQGDVDLESKSFTSKSKDKIKKPQQEFFAESKARDEQQGDQEENIDSPEILPSTQSEQFPSIASSLELEKPSKIFIYSSSSGNNLSMMDNNEKRDPSDYDANAEELQLSSNIYNENLDWEPNVNFDPEQCNFKISEDIMGNALTGATSERRFPNKPAEICLISSAELSAFHKDRRSCADFLPETLSLSGNMGSLSGCKLDEFTPRNTEPTSELDIRTTRGKRLDMMKISRSANDTHDMTQDTIIWGRLNANSANAHRRLNLQSPSEERKSLEALRQTQNGGLLQKSVSCTSKNLNGTLEDDHGFNLIVEKMNESLENALDCAEKSSENLECLESGRNIASDFTEDMEGITKVHSTDKVMSQNSSKGLNDSNNDETNKESLTPSKTSSQEHSTDSSILENGITDFGETSEPGTHKFKLHSEKMYWGPNNDMTCLPPKSFALTESEEAFIDEMENVIQIIEPPENDAEDSAKILFSLLSEVPGQKSTDQDDEPEPEIPYKKDIRETENPTRRVFSGMTTIGPMKNLDYDPRDLTAGEIDFGKMTRITSSRQLTKEMGMFGPEMTTIKILEEEYSDENVSVNTEDDRVDRTSLVNRDIASMTKVQKVREVMSYQPRLEEDFDDDEPLTRARLDLKDVESMTDERYKVPDLGIPLLSFEIGESNSDAEKELIDRMGLVISGLTNPAYYDDSEEDIAEITSDSSNRVLKVKSKMAESLSSKSMIRETVSSKNMAKEIVSSKSVIKETISSKSMTKETTGEARSLNVGSETKFARKEEEEDSPRIYGSESQQHVFTQPKHGTLGSVFRKASNKFMRKESEISVRNSKSLPRDASRISATDSIRSILDDCQSSASSMIRKSRSLLKNTQSIFKSISHSRMSLGMELGHGTDSKKLSPSESDVSAMEKKFSGFLKKEDFTKAKNVIKEKVEKVLKNFDTATSSVDPPETTHGNKNLQVAIKNDSNLQVEKLENFQKWLPKSPQVYKSQFVRSQTSVQELTQESEEPPLNSVLVDEQKISQEILSISAPEDDSTPSEEIEPQEQPEVAESEGAIPLQEKLQWVKSQEDIQSESNEEFTFNDEPQQPDFIVMETIQGLSASDLESPSSEKENLNVENTGIIEADSEESDLKKVEASNSVQEVSDGSRDVAPCFPEIDEDKLLTKAPSDKKMKPKKKKFTARFRSFWCSTFGRVKTPPKKGDVS